MAPAEGILLRHKPTGRRAVTLANGAYRVTARRKRGRRTSVVTGIVPVRAVEVRFRKPGPVREVTSVLLGHGLEFARHGDTLRVGLALPVEGDELILK